MHLKLGSVVFAMVFAFIIKISYETVTSQKAQADDTINERSPASIDKSYLEHMNRR